MHQIFRTPDLLHEIFPYLSQHMQTVTARVCKLWFTYSIKFIWDTVSIEDVLRVLSPFDDNGFKQPLLPESWRRFSLYSTNIRLLRCWVIPYATLRQALLWRSNVDLFSSKLTTLSWNGKSEYIEYLPPLVTSTLQILKVDLGTIESLNTLDVLRQTILLCLPSLRSFQLGFAAANDHAQAVSRSLSELFSLLSEIVLIRLPPHCMSGELLTTLSRLPQLQELSLCRFSCFPSDKDVMERLRKRKIDYDEKTRKEIPFRSLEKMCISDSDSVMAEVLRRGIQLLTLVYLEYWGPFYNYTLMESLHRACPNLRKVSIIAYKDIPFQAIQSLLKCPALVEIDLDGDRFVDLKLEDIVTIATNRSSWQIITLPSVKPLSYQALVAFAQNCPDLYELKLTLDSKLGIPDLDALTMDVKFSSLTSLHIIGDSELTPDLKLVLFLSKICLKPIKIIGDHELWETVEKLVNIIIATQLENRRLKDENVLLHAQRCFHDF